MSVSGDQKITKQNTPQKNKQTTPTPPHTEKTEKKRTPTIKNRKKNIF